MNLPRHLVYTGWHSCHSFGIHLTYILSFTPKFVFIPNLLRSAYFGYLDGFICFLVEAYVPFPFMLTDYFPGEV